MKIEEIGITLIALVITIIVLLILAGVAIATLTGENGILTQAENAGEQTEISEVIEKAKLDILAWQTEKEANNEEYTLTDNVIKNIITGKDYVKGEPGETSFVSTNGHTISYADLYESPMTITEAKELANGFDKNTILVDEFGNTVKVPEGFKIASDSATNVTGGVVIEDATDGATAGSQFVWIPVGTVYTNEERTEYKIIKLSRYIFDEEGKETDMGINAIEHSSRNYFFEELETSDKGNITAKEIEIFKTKASNSNGYYIGRYEARTIEPRKNGQESEKLTQITLKANDYIYWYVKQPQAATLSREMYSSTNFTSDLVNSYAYDTAVVFLQTFDNRENKETLKPYSRQNSLNSGNIALQGTNNLESQYQDEICNIWDMASNCREWTTETYSNPAGYGVYRGGNFEYSNVYTSGRYYYDSIANPYPLVTFRPILYL